jgi:inorganic pyrophosphatase
MTDFSRLPLWAEGGLAHVVVETPRGSRVKIAYDPDLLCFTMSRALPIGVSYPYDWGFLPSTLGEDGDPLDALLIHEAPTSPGLVIKCRIAGALKVSQRTKGETQRNDRIIAVPDHDSRADWDDVRALSKDVKWQLEKFFEAAIITEKKELNFLGWAGPKEALNLIKAGEKAASARSG